MSCPGKPYARALTVSLALLVPAAGTGAALVLWSNGVCHAGVLFHTSCTVGLLLAVTPKIVSLPTRFIWFA